MIVDRIYSKPPRTLLSQLDARPITNSSTLIIDLDRCIFTVEPSVPDIYRRAWSTVATDGSSESFAEPSDADIPLGLLHKLLSSAGGLGAGSAEQVSGSLFGAMTRA